MQRVRQHLLFYLLLAIFAVFLLWPIGRVLQVAFFGIAEGGKPGSFTFAYLAGVFADHEFRMGLMNSAIIAVCVTALCLVISVPLALMSVRLDFCGKGVANALLLVPLILPPFVGAIGMRQILGRFGVLTSVAQHMGFVPPDSPVDWFGKARIAGIVLIEALSLYPILFLNVSASLANLDPAMEQAAANLGASRWRIFRKITLPLMRPGLFAGGTIVLIWSFTELGTPLMFDYAHVTPVQIFNRLTQVQGNPLPYGLVVVTLVTSVLLYFIGKFVLGRRQDAAITKASIQFTAKKLSWWRSLPVLAAFLFVSGLALLPHIGVILYSVSGVGAWYQSAIPKVFTAQHYVHGLSHELALPSVLKSIQYASLSMILDLILGLTIAWLLVRSTLRGRQILDSLAMLPLAVPGLVLAFGYLGISLQFQAWLPANWQKVRALLDVQQNPTLMLLIVYAIPP